MNRLKEIYSLLLAAYGHKNWWPVTEENEIIPKYNGGPRNEKQQLEVIFGAILTQNTGWKNAEKAVIELNKHNLIGVNKIIRINEKKLASLIRSSGYYKQKAKKLKNFCNFLKKDYDGQLKKLFSNDINGLRKELLSINGIGPETADSIILYSAGKPIFVIDAYTRRIFNRVGFKESSYDELQKLFMKSLPNSEKLFNEYHALIVEHAKAACRAKPLCQGCPIIEYCKFVK